MDNLTLQQNPIILNMINMINNFGRQCILRAPYWSMDGAIEHVFNTVQTRLRVFLSQQTTMDKLKNTSI